MKKILQWPYNLLLPIIGMICTLILAVDNKANIETLVYGFALGIQYMAILECYEKRHKKN